VNAAPEPGGRLQGEKILIVGPTGNTGPPLCSHLAQSNEVWALARFSTSGSEARLRDMGVVTVTADLAHGVPSELPDDFTYVVNLAAFIGPGSDFDYAMTVNAEAPGLLMQHCRTARAFLHVSTGGVYAPFPDPWHRKRESDPTEPPSFPFSPTYGHSKLAGEAVVRTMARALGLPTTIARLNAAYDANGGLPAFCVDWIRNGLPVPLPPEDVVYCPIHHEDMARQVEAMLMAASVPATITNWCGDEIVSIRQWCDYVGSLLGITVGYEAGAPHMSSAMDPTRRRAITGPCAVDWRTGMQRIVTERSAELTPHSAAIRSMFVLDGQDP
jgi:nucleoside-diphosphate-sugar epimerase